MFLLSIFIVHVPFWVLDATYEIQATCTSHNWSLSTCGDFLGMIGEVHNKTYSFQIKLEAKNLLVCGQHSLQGLHCWRPD